jgi:arylsulfatase A-like enzyme
MLTGSCPSEHGVWWNTYIPELGYAAGTDLFDLAHARGLRTVMVVGKEKLRQVTEPASTDVFEWVDEADPVIARRAAEVMRGGFSVLFVHLRGPDEDGHASGWLSAEQLEGLRETDEAVRIVLEGLEAANMREGALIILTADHGGHGTTHGTDNPEDTTIPWIINGPGVVPGRLAGAINTTDTAATAAWALELPHPVEWSGNPVLEAFGIQEEASRPEPRCP